MASPVRIIVIVFAVLLLAGLVLPFVMRARVDSDRVGCQNHLRELGFFGVRHASVPGTALPPIPRDELPPGTFENAKLQPDHRMSWYVYPLGALDGGGANLDPQAKQRRPSGLTELLATFQPAEPWNSASNTPLANYRLTTAICPAQVPVPTPGSPSTSNYLALGGIGLETPSLKLDEAGKNAGAYRFDGATSDKAFIDGLHQTAQIIETNKDLGAWLRGGSSTLRGLDPTALPYLGIDRPFGGCHIGGTYASMADGSVRFLKDTMDPAVFRALLTLAGGPDEQGFDAP